MKTRSTQRGLELTEIGLGAAQLGNLYRETTDAEVEEGVAAAWDAGVRYFDTAPHYGLGLSERRLGEQLRTHPRDEYVISSKVGKLLVPNPGGEDRMDDEGFAVPAVTKRQWDFSRDGILRSVEESLARTGLDHFDVLYMHDPDDHFEQASTEGIAALIELREQGVVKAVGAGMNAAAPLAELIRRADVDLVMCAGRFTLIDDDALADLMPLALERNVGIVVAGVYNSGLLGRNRPSPDATFDYGPVPPAVLERANRVADVCEAHGVTLPEAAIAYVLRHPAVVSVVVGARGGDQVRSNIERYAATMPDGLWSDLEAAGLIAAL
ncbi:aldo/keto reductase [Salinibacterium sp. NSLL150]|uniref:aldo/keto reductase n=1 Tax=unclassified Salinibacterium TaxID=2632331 RepID=UPI0018CE5681|nr:MULTISPECIES: aldo/keto reductase [unclassified Salinibacterium]MBH0097823.1 aldo/keto reductase [Salinibacterium sp. NSLL35]MBH0100578.1 aldo/keto reductase [Salinibacterium sp. NSLL150]MBH0103337.1 aldo/keto reductase [Salinibacterium sp. NSLL16]MBH0106098.1 aldo/keto reductase [Salinibacterium sp. NSLL17]